MIKVEIVEISGKQFRRTISDTYLIRKVGTNEIYSEAVDVLDTTYKYEETEVLLAAQEVEI